MIPVKRTMRVPQKSRKRVRPTDNYSAAVAFIAAATQHIEKSGQVLTVETTHLLKPLFGNFCANYNLRGKEKESVWRIVCAQIRDVKATAKPGEEL